VKGLWAVGVVLLLGSCGPAPIEPRPLPVAPSARAEKVGAGFLATESPDVKVGTNRRGELVSPKTTQDFHGPPTSNTWWSSLIWQHDAANPYSLNLFAHPLVLRAARDGLGLSYPTQPEVARREYMYRFAEDLRAGIVGMISPDTRVASYSDWAVTAEWRAEHGALRATMGHGLPFVYFSKTDSGSVFVRVAEDKARNVEVWHEGDAVLGLTVAGHAYGVFGPTKSRWTHSGTSFTSDLAGSDYFSVAVLPDAKRETLELFRTHAYAFVTKTSVSWRYDEAKAELETQFALATAPKEMGSDLSSEPLFALYRHQWLASQTPMLAHEYVSPRGAMKLSQGPSFSTKMKFHGILPILPEADPTNLGKLRSYVDSAYAADDLFPNGFGSNPGKDAYWIGKSFGRNTSLLLIADQIGHAKAKKRLLRALENQLEDWFDGHDPSDFYYDARWHSVVGRPPSYGSADEINDHHFHYGYFVGAAATVIRFDPAWASRWGKFVELLIRDVANWDRNDRRFPFLRYMDAYAGHSWANGPAQFDEGNNQEASSEDINFSASAILWGALTENRAIRDLGIFLYTNQVAAIQQYWFDVDRQVFPKGFDYTTAAMVWGAGAKYDTWFDQDPILIHGINFLPFTGASLYLGLRPDYVNRNFDEIFRQSRGVITTWRDYALMFLALGNPSRALELYRDDPYFEPEFGNTKALAYHWISNLAALGGHVDATTTADVPTYAVFKSDDRRAYVVFNPTPRPLTVTFSDAMKLTVLPRQQTHSVIRLRQK
jgi:endoglucanase Acf2